MTKRNYNRRLGLWSASEVLIDDYTVAPPDEEDGASWQKVINHTHTRALTALSRDTGHEMDTDNVRSDSVVIPAGLSDVEVTLPSEDVHLSVGEVRSTIPGFPVGDEVLFSGTLASVIFEDADSPGVNVFCDGHLVYYPGIRGDSVTGKYNFDRDEWEWEGDQ